MGFASEADLRSLGFYCSLQFGPFRATTGNASNRSDDTADDQDSLTLRLIKLLNDDQVIAKLKKSLFPKELTTTIDQLTVSAA